MTKILFFGGDRLKENTPLSSLAQYFLKKKVETIIITDPMHLKKKCLNGLTFKELIKKKKIKISSIQQIK